MSLINNPLYDGDIANKKYVDDAIQKALSSYTPSEDEEQEGVIGNKNFGAQPNPPYNINDTWTREGEIWICVTSRLIGEYNQDDWVKLIDTEPYDDFITQVYPADKIIIQQQLDNKTETFISANDPADEWVTSLDKDVHVGDFWRKELNGLFETYIYTKFNTDPISYSWVRQDVPSDVWDAIDGKKSIYTSKPTKYEEDDLWIVSETDVDLPDGIIAGDYLVATQSSDVYDKTHWTKANSNVEIEQVKKHFYTKEEIDTTVETVRGDVTTEITETVNGFKTEVSQEYATITTVNSVIQDLEDLDTEVGTISEKTETLNTKYSELEQTQENIILSVEEIEQTTNETVVKVNKTIKQIIPYYAVSSSNITPPEEWETTPPTRPEGWFMWRKDLIIFQDDTQTYSTAYVVTGDQGDDGSIYSDVAPEDTNKLWFNTVENVLYTYNVLTNAWEKTNDYDEAVKDLGNRTDDLDVRVNDVNKMISDTYNKNEIDNLLTNQEQEIIKRYSAELNVASTNITASVKTEIQQSGVSMIKNTNVVIDENGMNVSDTSNSFNTQITTGGFYCNNDDISLVEVTKDGSKLKNTFLRGKTIVDDVILYEKYNDVTFGKGLAHFYVGED